jgi:hypothetical protein
MFAYMAQVPVRMIRSPPSQWANGQNQWSQKAQYGFSARKNSPNRRPVGGEGDSNPRCHEGAGDSES